MWLLDYDGLQNIEQKYWSRKKARVERFLEPSLTTTHRRIETFDFGLTCLGNCPQQIYNKTAGNKEAQKQCVLNHCGPSTAGNPELPVWLEFFVSSVISYGIWWWNRVSMVRLIFSLSNCPGALWTYATEEWLRFVDVAATEDSNTRRPTHLIWQAIKCAYTVDCPINETRTAAEDEARVSHLCKKTTTGDQTSWKHYWSIGSTQAITRWRSTC